MVPVIALAATAAASTAAAEDFPQLKPGLWEFSRAKSLLPSEGKPPTESVRQCTSPTEDMRKKWAQLASGECHFSPIAHDGKRFTYSSICKRYDVEFQIKSVVTVNSEGDYRVDTESRGANGASNEIVIAHRLGDCSPGSKRVNTHTTEASLTQ